MLRKHYSLAHADRVLKLLNRIARQIGGAGEVRCWANGREQGYFVIAERPGDGDLKPSACAVFAQTRNGDSVVVVTGAMHDFDLQSGSPSNQIWGENRAFFDDDEKAAAALAKALWPHAYRGRRKPARRGCKAKVKA